MLFSTIAELSDKIPQGKVVGVHTHNQLSFNQFRPSHLAPQAFTTMANIDKMKQFIEKFVTSDAVKKEVGEVTHFKKWLENFDLQNIS